MRQAQRMARAGSIWDLVGFSICFVFFEVDFVRRGDFEEEDSGEDGGKRVFCFSK